MSRVSKSHLRDFSFTVMTFESPRNSFCRFDHVFFDVVAATIHEKIASWTACWIMNRALASFFLVSLSLYFSSIVGSNTSTNSFSTKSHSSCDLSKVFILMLYHSYFSPLKIGNNDAEEEKSATAIFVLWNVKIITHSCVDKNLALIPNLLGKGIVKEIWKDKIDEIDESCGAVLLISHSMLKGLHNYSIYRLIHSNK